ncbi:MAG: hypothetical protein ABSG81_12475, partial [Acidimicrobiales bacterium]
PILLGPFGLTTILTPPPPMPAAVTVEFLPPLDWHDLGPEAAQDADAVDRCYEQTTTVMQAALDGLRAARPHPVLRGAAGLLRAAGGRRARP